MTFLHQSSDSSRMRPLSPSSAATSSWPPVVAAASVGGVYTQTKRSMLRNNERQRFDPRTLAQETIRPFEYLNSEAIKSELESLQETHPKFITLGSSQDWYDLPTAGTANDCPFDSSVTGCKNYIMIIEDPSVPDPSVLAEVFLSGSVHGNERIGPTTVMETARLLVESAECEALPRSKSDISEEEWEDDVRKAKDCRSKLQKQGIFPWARRWMARLVSTRRIVVVPSANALGYYQNKRTEGSIDPNRDFAFDQENWSHCMRTIAGRTINEVYREHMFQHSLTFHGGMVAIAYEWGAPSRNTPKGIPSPDDTAQVELGFGLSNYAGSFTPSSEGYKYPHDSMNNLVYPVNGGMEDWAYGGSWDLDLVSPCTPTTFGGYDKSKTTYNNATLRAFNVLIETSDNKQPAPNTLGTDEGLFNEMAGNGNGHISRNIRLAQMMIDTVEPYVSVLAVEDIILPDDIVPLSNRGGRACLSTNVVAFPKGTKKVEVFWTVGGSFTIDETRVAYGTWDVAFSGLMDCSTQPKKVADLFTESIKLTSTQSGRTRWHNSGASPSSDSTWLKEEVGGSIPYGPIFSAIIDLSEYNVGDKVAIMPYAKVDQNWKNQPETTDPEVPPQSHVVNARTNPDWHFESAGKVVQGRLDWVSSPLTIEIGPEGVTPEIKNARLSPSGESLPTGAPVPSSPRPSGEPLPTGAPVPSPLVAVTPDSKSKEQSHFWAFLLVPLAGVAGVFCFVKLLRRRNTSGRGAVEVIEMRANDAFNEFAQTDAYRDDESGSGSFT
eukprot:CAMPEP_0196801782 /NCGR_PEP_ID=MMETSP1362-20130617/1558_1 /TAXON_ID=163516 /ORGANISM="Leptocylindrus danicus, Strain CCMP1856" /LENGTH=775 /DNA_ID=CAMNT_0042172905 /DNA_START=192 /DNA_END=2519 /DNA_ORIENTATION=-